MTSVGGVGIEHDPCHERTLGRMGQLSVPGGMMPKWAGQGDFSCLEASRLCVAIQSLHDYFATEDEELSIEQFFFSCFAWVL